MKIVCYKDTLLKALNSVIKGVASKTTNPILEGILIQTNENQVKLSLGSLFLIFLRFGLFNIYWIGENLNKLNL